MSREEMARRAISKAAAVNPPVFRVDEGFYAVGSSRPGVGYLLEVNEGGDLWCPCEASQRGLPCYHRAALGLFFSRGYRPWTYPSPCRWHHDRQARAQTTRREWLHDALRAVSQVRSRIHP
jgi:hypothetical protein